MEGRIRYVIVAEEEAGRRMDNFLIARFPRVTRSHLYRTIRSGEVRVNSRRVKAATRLAAGDRVRIVAPLSLAPAAPTASGALLERLRAAILFESDQLLVINKPAGLAVHGGSGVRSNLIHGLRALYPHCANLELVHRLDRDTSGCLLVAKKHSVLRYLHEQLRTRRIERRYVLLTTGNWPARRRYIDAPLLKFELQGERRVRVSADGKASLTYFRVIRRFADASLLLAAPYSGRTHQIRVHAACAGHPVAGDTKYGIVSERERWRALGLRSSFLHAARLRFIPPGEETALKVDAPIPEELHAVLKRLEQEGS